MPRNKQSPPTINDGSPSAQKRNKKAKLRATASAKALKIAQPERVKRYVESIKKVKPLISILDKNCLTCRRYAKCDDKKKRFNYICDRFKPLRDDISTQQEVTKQPQQTPFIVHKKKLVDERRDLTESELSDVKFRKIIDQALEEFQTTQLPPDILIDDRDLPLAKNIIDFTSKEFLNTELFAKQVEVGLHLNADYCPDCSDRKYVFNIPLHDKLPNILERVQLLKWGKCPRCKQTRSDFYNDGKMKVPVELAGLAGQRCVTGDTILNTSKGFITFKQLAKHHINIEGFTNYNGPEIVLENGAVVAPDKFYRGKKENIYKLTTFNGFEIKGRNEHPIKTHRGWVQLQHIKDTDALPIYINQQIWSCTKLGLRDVARKAKALTKIYLKTVHVNSKKITCNYLDFGTLDDSLAKLIGFYIAEGHTRRISNIDEDVLNFCQNQFTRLYGAEHVNRRNNEISLRFRSSQIHWNILVEDMQRRSAKKQIPQHIMAAPKNIVCAFLQALYEGDGSASENMVSYTSISKVLIKQISVLLNNLGIPHRVHPFMTWATNGSINQVSKKAWQIDIEGEFACTRFRDQINFFSNRKKLQLLEVITKNTIDMPCFYSKFPDVIKTEFLSILDEINSDLGRYRNWSRSKHAFQMDQSHTIRGMFDLNSDFTRIYAENVALSKRRLKDYYNTITNHYLYGMVREKTKVMLDKFYRKYSGDDVYWVSVKNVKILKKQQAVYDIRVPIFHRFMANGFLNHNSGKSAYSKVQLAYSYHRFLKLPNAAAVFGLLPEEILNSYLVGLTFAKAKTLLFDGVHNYLKKAPWFLQYNEFLDSVGKRMGEQLYNIKDHYINYRHRNLMIQPQGPDMRKMRGITAFTAAIDEIGWFINSASARNITGDGGNAIKINGTEVYTSVSNAFTTMAASYKKLLGEGKCNLPPPFLLNTSSPSSKKDMIVQLYKVSRNSPDIYGYHYATYEFNPNISRADLNKYFNANYAKALRDFGAVPPNSSLPFIEKMKQIKPLCSPAIANNLSYRPAFSTLQSGVNKLTGRVIFRKNETNIPHIMCFDAGHSNNCFTGETKVITEYGVKRIDKLGDNTTILTEGSKWVKANFSSFGKQVVYEVNLSLHGKKKTIRCTGNHRWFIYNKRNKKTIELTTKQLTAGKVLQSVLPPNRHYNIELDEYGVRHGAVFGDGTIIGRKKNSCRATLVDNKIDYLEPYFKSLEDRGKYYYRRNYNNNRLVVIEDLPVEYKTFPKIKNYSKEHLLGFLAGYIATDGCVDKKGSVMINSFNKSVLSKLRNLCTFLGIATSPITSQTAKTSYSSDLTTCYKLFFIKGTFDPKILLNTEHRTRVEQGNNKNFKSPAMWKVESVINTKHKEEVFCCDVPNTHNFALEDYILTGNSFAIVTGYYDSKKDMPVFDGFIEVIPTADTPISFTAMFDDIMTPIIEKMNVKFVASDRWQNLKFFSDIESAFEIETGQHSLKYDKFLQFKEDVDGVNFLMPMPEVKFKDIDALTSNDYPNSFLYKPVSHVISQMLTVQDVSKDVIKGPELTDDLFRAMVLAHSYLNDPDYMDLFAAIGEDVVVKRALGAVGSSSGTGSAGKSINGIATSASRGR